MVAIKNVSYLFFLLAVCLDWCLAQVGYSPKTPGSDPYATPDPYATTIAIPEAYEITTPLFPLDSCYFNKHGYMCCNKELEALIEQAYDDKSKTRDGKWPTCNLHQIAVDVQKAAQDKFGVDFEAISSAGDFASRDLICKIKAGPQTIMAYATPRE
ncbi:hypothetical protein M3Y97_00818400 [Aphelenchoides bicaudatus]|nr:hypothetical protein M3Y97_00818400 [Aphelenchoides bicaudatus]